MVVGLKVDRRARVSGDSGRMVELSGQCQQAYIKL